MPLAFIGPWEALILIGIIAFLFGAKRIGPATRAAVRGAKEFKREITGEQPKEQRALPPARDEQKTS